MIKRHLADIARERARLIRFAVVGGSGVLVNAGVFEAVFWMAQGLQSTHQINLAALLGFFVSFCSNFLLNNYWTWADKNASARMCFMSRLLAYFTVAGSALLVQLVVLNTLSSFMEPRWANIVGIGAGTVVNFSINHLWTFRSDRGPDHE